MRFYLYHQPFFFKIFDNYFSGFETIHAIIFSDITEGLRSEARAEFLLHSFQNRIRHSTTSIKSAIGIMQEYPEMDPQRRLRLIEIIKNESTALGHLIQRDAETALPSKDTFVRARLSLAAIRIHVRTVRLVRLVRGSDRLILRRLSLRGSCGLRFQSR